MAALSGCRISSVRLNQASFFMTTENDNYVVITILGKAESEELKFFRWPQWKEVCDILDVLLSDFGATPYYAFCDIHFSIPLKPRKNDPPGANFVTARSVPLGRLRWTSEHNKKWSQKLDKPYEYKECEYPVHLLSACVASSKNDKPPVVQVMIQNRPVADMFNQVISIAVNEKFYKTKQKECWQATRKDYWKILTEKLAENTSAVCIGKTIRPWAIHFKDQNGYWCVHAIGGVSLAETTTSLDLKEFQSHSKWTYLSLPRS
jgi:hypothetical protein